ncbi:MAG: hypothetical protein SVY10_15290 [Thermodesulfobacteriota bacterium]|nr:hypothetical protein [Thermodesulfobacteriota bacterium]
MSNLEKIKELFPDHDICVMSNNDEDDHMNPLVGVITRYQLVLDLAYCSARI